MSNEIALGLLCNIYVAFVMLLWIYRFVLVEKC